MSQFQFYLICLFNFGLYLQNSKEKGPFGQSSGSFSTDSYGRPISVIRAFPSIHLATFSIAFYFGIFSPGHINPRGNVVGLYTDDSSAYDCGHNRFSISAIGMNLAIQVFDARMDCKYGNKFQKQEFYFENFFKITSDGWNFVSLVYDGKQITAFNDDGFFDLATGVEINQQRETTLITVGSSTRDGNTYFFPTDMSIACLVVYRNLLSWLDLLKIQCACREHLNSSN